MNSVKQNRTSRGAFNLSSSFFFRCISRSILFVFVAALHEFAAADDEENPHEADGENHGDDTCQCHDMEKVMVVIS